MRTTHSHKLSDWTKGLDINIWLEFLIIKTTIPGLVVIKVSLKLVPIKVSFSSIIEAEGGWLIYMTRCTNPASLA